MKQYKHKDYKEYVEAQVDKNERKIKNVWVNKGELISLSKQIKKCIPNISFGICHGVRNSWEVKVLRQLLGIHIIGTEISPSATNFKNTIQWDFHKLKDEWINSVDFIYSNSFDHSYDPSKCLDVWMKCIKKHKGICFIHWMSTNVNKVDAADCFAGSLKEYRELFNKKYTIIKEFGGKGRIVFAIKHKEK